MPRPRFTCSGSRPAEAQIIQRFRINGEEPYRCTIFRRHVRYGCAVRKTETRKSGAVEFYELADDTFRAQHLSNGEHDVGCRCAFRNFAVQLESDNQRYQHRERLAEHRAFGFDSADAPAHNAQPIDHCRVRIGTDQGVWIGSFPAVLRFNEDGLRNVFEIYLMHDTDVGWHDATILKGRLSPFQKDVSFAVPLQFPVGIEGESGRRSELIDLDRMIDDKIHLLERIDLPGIAAHLLDYIAHRGQVHDSWHAGKILHQDSSRPECDFFFRLFSCRARRDCTSISSRDGAPVFETQQVFEHHPQRKRQLRYGADARFFGLFQREVIVFGISDL